MKEYIYPLLAIAIGLGLLYPSADRFVTNAAAVAHRRKVSPFLVGMVIVGVGTSLPEMFVSSLASLRGSSGIALGNAYGSNITNIGLILGFTALSRPLRFNFQSFWKEMVILLAITGVAAYQILDGRITRFEGFVMLGLFFAIMALRNWTAKTTDGNSEDQSEKLAENSQGSRKEIFWIAASLLLLIASSRLLVWGAIEMAEILGISDLVIGLTVVAIGTSLPEFASSLAAARQGEHDIAIGNVLGSNFFNTLIAVGLAGAIKPLEASSFVLQDVGIMAIFTIALLLIGFTLRRRYATINRFEGALLLGAYLVYTYWIFVRSY